MTIDRRGIGIQLVKRGGSGKKCGGEWLHVDFEPNLQNFYEQCGFRNTTAGLIRLKSRA